MAEVSSCQWCKSGLKIITYADRKGERKYHGWCNKCDGPAESSSPDERAMREEFRKEFGL